MTSNEHRGNQPGQPAVMRSRDGKARGPATSCYTELLERQGCTVEDCSPLEMGPCQNFLLTFPERELEASFRGTLTAERARRDTYCHAVGMALWLIVFAKLLHSARFRDLFLALCGATQSFLALLLWRIRPGAYVRWRNHINIFIKLSSACIGVWQGILPLGIRSGGLASVLIPECFVWNKVMLLIFTSLGMPLLLGEHLWVHLLATLIVASGNMQLCALSELEVPGSLAVFTNVLIWLTRAGSPYFEVISLQPLDSCIAVQGSLQALLGLVAPTVILFSWETAARDTFLGNGLPSAGHGLRNTVDWVMLSCLLLFLGPITLAISLVIASWI